MRQTIDAVFEEGMLRPLEPLSLEPNERVRVTIEAAAGATDEFDEIGDHEYTEMLIREGEALGPAPTLEEVRAALSKIPGNLSDEIRAERDLG